MSRNERFWRETMDKLDEKYVNETSEELFEHLGEEHELVEIHVERPEKKKKSVGAWIGAAAALVVIGGTAVALRMTNVLPAKPNEGIEITLPSETTSTTAVFAAPETTEMTLPVPEGGNPPSMQNFDGIEIYENIFWGSWSNSAETIRFTYKEDPLPEEAVAAAVTKQEEGYFLQVYGQGDYGWDVSIGVYYIPADETNKMYFYEDEESTTAQVYTRVWQETRPDNGLIVEKGALNFIGQQKLAREMCFEGSDGFYHLRRIYETPLYNADGERLDIICGKVRLGENITSKKLNEFTLTVNCKYSDSDIYEQITLSLSRGEKSWKIASASDAAGNIYKTDLVAGSTELIDLSVLDGDGIASKESLALLEETFYGIWESDFDTLSLTYTEDNQFPGYTFITWFTEREDGWYLNEFTSGTGTLYFIAREEPEKMYRYEDFTGVNDVAKNEYYCVYTLKSRGSTEIPQGVISLLGINKIFVEYGVNIWDIMPKNIQYNGKEYEYDGAASWYWGYGETYINEPVTDSKVVFSHRYCEVTDNVDELNKPNMKYFTFAAEKVNDEWEAWEITDTYITLEVSENYSVQYFNDTDGKYYALETLIAMSSHDLSILYHWDGYSYTAVSENLINCRAAEIDGVLYLLYYDKANKALRLRENRMYVGKNMYTEVIVSETAEVYPSSYSIRTVGDYVIVEYAEADADTMRVSLFSKYLDFCGKTTESYVTEISDSGFKMIINGEEVTYTTDENDLAGRLWHLNRSSEMFYMNTVVGSPTIDFKDSFTKELPDSDITMTYYRVVKPPFDNYQSLSIALNEIFTENARYYIDVAMFQEGTNFETKNNSNGIYSADGARGADISVGDVTCRIKEQTDTQAVLEYTVYGVDENFNASDEVIETYEVTAENDGSGWRLNEMRWPY